MTSPTGEKLDTDHAQPPTSNAISGFSRVYTAGDDENLPEVYVDGSPHALTQDDPHSGALFDAQSPKFAVQYDDSPKTAIPPEYSESHQPVSAITPASDGGNHPDSANPSPTNNKRICGLGRKTVFVLLAILLIVIAAGVGGGVGGAVAAKSKSSNDKDSPTDAQPSVTSKSTST